MSLSRLNLVNCLFVVSGCLMCLMTLPSKASDYSIDLADGTNPAHSGMWRVDISYDPTNNTIVIKIVNGPTTKDNKGNTIVKPGQDTWDGWTYTVPATVNGDTVTFDGTSSIPTKPDGTKGTKNDQLTFTGATLDKKTQEVKIGSISSPGGGKFPINSVKVAPPPGPPIGGKAGGTNIPKDKSLNFDSLTQTLTIHGSTFVRLPDPGDPLLGAAVTYPTFSLTGFNAEANAYMFVNQNLSDGITISNATTVFQQSFISALVYNVPEDIFYGVLLDNSFNPTGSPFISYISSVLDPTTSLYDPLAASFVEIKPDVNFYALTQGWHTTETAGGKDKHYVAPQAPEPGTYALIGSLGLTGAAFLRRRKACKAA